MTDLVGPLAVRQPLGEEHESPHVIGPLLVLAGLSAVVRLACFPFDIEMIDAAARVALAIRWLHHPGVMSATECSQYGPLPIYLNAGILSIWNTPYTAPRFLSLIFGSATVVPLFFLTRLLFGRRAAIFSGVFFAFYTLQVKSSITAMAEAPFGFLFLAGLFYLFRFRRDGTTRDLYIAAVWISLACLVRYEGWLYVPLFGLLSVRPSARSGGGAGWLMDSLKSAVGFVMIASLCPILWMTMNYVKGADPLWAWHFIAKDHAQLAEMALVKRGGIGGVIYNLFFSPGVLLLSLTPAVAILSLAGFLRALARRQTLAYAALLLPSLVYVAETLGMRMAPLARLFTLTGLLLLPYAGAQMAVWTAGLSRSAMVRRATGVILSAVIVFLALLSAAFLPGLPFHQKCWSVSPVSPFLPEEKEVFDLLKERMKPGDQLVQDGNTAYTHTITFNISPDIYENWWARPTIDEGLKTPEDRIRYLESSTPGFAVFETAKTDLPKLLNVPAERMSDFSKITIRQIYSSPRYTVYELAPKMDRHRRFRQQDSAGEGQIPG